VTNLDLKIESNSVASVASLNGGVAKTPEFKTVEFRTVDRSMVELVQLSENIAKSKASVLIQGAPGSGKKTLARSIFQKSQRANKPFQIFNASEVAIGDQDLEFKKVLEAAVGGSLLLIEVAKLSSMSQARLNQAMNEGRDIRFIATTSKSLSALVKIGDFREDLFYRLNVVNLKIPALAERMGDVEHLANFFVQKWASVHGKDSVRVLPEAVQLLNGHSWSGNVRELDSTVERAVLLCQNSEIRARDIQVNTADSRLPSLEQALGFSWKPGRTLDEIERNVILEALKYHDGNRTHTAKSLGISIRTLRNKLAEYRVMGINA
jgi:two-component system response regulator FlrC